MKLKLSFLSKYNKVINQLQWKYFIGEYKPKQQDKMERQFKTLSSVDQSTAREMEILLDNISKDSALKDELGINPYNLYPIGLSSFVNFHDLSNLVSYKVHDLTRTSQLFGDILAKGKTEVNAKDVQDFLANTLLENKNYLNNFAKGYIIIKLPKMMDDKAFDLNATLKPFEFVSHRFDKEANTIVIQTK